MTRTDACSVVTVFPLDDGETVVLLIGMAVGVDYSLFYDAREREEHRGGSPPHAALETTARTSGRTVIVSGTTVAIAMAGMYIVGSKVLKSDRDRDDRGRRVRGSGLGHRPAGRT